MYSHATALCLVRNRRGHRSKGVIELNELFDIAVDEDDDNNNRCGGCCGGDEEEEEEEEEYDDDIEDETAEFIDTQETVANAGCDGGTDVCIK